MRVSLFGAVLWLMAVRAARGDYLDWRLDISCDVQAGRVEIGAYGAANQGVLGPETRDCTLSTRRTVRAKIGFGPVLPYGFGRGTPMKGTTSTSTIARHNNVCNFLEQFDERHSGQ